MSLWSIKANNWSADNLKNTSPQSVLHLTGFIQSLEFLKKSWNLPSNFPDLEKVWKMEIKFGKMFFFSFKAIAGALWVHFFSVGQILFNCSASWKKPLFLRFFKGFYWSHFDNLESGKRKYCCGKKSGKSLEFWIQKSVQTLTSAHHTGMWYYSARTLFWQLSIDHNIDVHYQVKHRLYMPLTPCL